MTREEKCKLAIERGYTYDPETGLIYNRYGKITKCINDNGYILLANNLRGHHFAWYWVYRECVNEIDHINNIRNDNRICNLRSVTRQQNHWNRSNVKGYMMPKDKTKWRVNIKSFDKIIFIGYFNTEEEARNAYLKAKEIYHKF